MKGVTLRLLALFAFAQLAGLMVGALFTTQEVSIVENAGDPANALYFFAGILVSTIVMLLVMRFYKGAFLFEIIEALLVFSAFNILLSSVLDMLASALTALAVVAVRFFYGALRQPAILAASIVVGALLGSSLDLVPVIFLALLLAAYDFGAVHWSKHMIVLAKGLEKRKAAFAVSVKQAKDTIQLGTGDFVVPIVLSVSALHSAGLPAAVFALAGAVAGFYILLMQLEKKKGYYPGLPPIMLAELLFLGAYFLAAPFLGF